MTPFSQPERRGLERLQGAPTHPDPDLLAAFSEQMLSAREREQMLAHLAVCASCREVVALALPEAVEEAVASLPARKPAFWKWPVLRWTTVAASAAVVVVAVSLGHHERTLEKAAQLGSELAPIAPQNPIRHDELFQPAASPGVKAPQIRYEKVAPKPSNKLTVRSGDNRARKNIERENNEAASLSPSLSGGVRAGARPATTAAKEGYDQFKATDKKLDEAQQDLALAATNVAPSGSPPQPELEARSVPSATEALSVTGETVGVPSQASAMRQTAPTAGPVNVSGIKSKPQFEINADTQKSFIANRDLRNQNAISAWQVTPEGYLLASTDQGRNWVRQLPEQRFTHVQSVGTHVWATGPDQLLMHSSDRGQNWGRVTPTDHEAKPEGEIISIVFLDVNRGTLKTTTGETWSTEDAGKSWKKH